MTKDKIIYQSIKRKIEFKWNLKNEIFWASLHQTTIVFNLYKSIISRHIRNIFRVEKLLIDSVVASTTVFWANNLIHVVIGLNYLNNRFCFTISNEQ